ncbi:MAG: hypothetical protein ABH832_00160 [bacterium]
MIPFVIELPFGISADISFWITLFSWPIFDIIKSIIAIIGWTIIASIFFYMGSILFVNYRSLKYMASWEWVVLAVDIPEELVQSPKAVEQIFAHLSGSLEDITVVEKYWKGKTQKWFSLEIISIEGYIQFLIITEDEHRDLVEAAIYAQYPEAEITEVEDYTGNIPNNYPNDTHKMIGIEFALAQADSYPIRTYSEFEHSFSKDIVFNDPMAALLENFSRLGAGENLWMQIVIYPTDNSWKEQGIELAKSLIEQRPPNQPNTFINKLGALPMKIGEEVINVWKWSFEPAEEDAIKKEERTKTVSELSPGMRTTVESIEEKLSRIGFKTKIRVMYSANNDIFKPSKCMNGLIGSINQFFNSSRNGFVPKLSTKLKDKANHKFIQSYINRKLTTGLNPYILNIEELATIWHFPLAFVKTPLIQKTASKRAEPPIDLPSESIIFDRKIAEEEIRKQEPKKVVTDADGNIDEAGIDFGQIEYNNTAEEEKFSDDQQFG